MSDFFKSLTAYDLINIFVPGVIVGAAADYLGLSSLFAGNAVVAAATCYVLGVLASRVGSIALEPAIKKAGFIKQRKYEDFVIAEAKDSNVDKLVMVGNMYRSLCGAICLIFLMMIWMITRSYIPEAWQFSVGIFLASVMTFALLIGSWVKQYGYVSKRIDADKEKQ